MIEGLAFHHLGVACRDIDAEAALLRPLGYEDEAAPFVDPLQGIRGRFLVAAGLRLELLESLPESATLDPWLRAGTKIYHHAYLVPALDAAIAALGSEGPKLVREPRPAVAFAMRRVAFLMLPNLMLVELVEAPAQAAGSVAQEHRATS